MDWSSLAGLAVAAGVIAAATGFGFWWRARAGRVRTMSPAAHGPHADLLSTLGVTAGTPVTLLQFSSAFCAPCRATRVTCATFAASHDGVRHVEVDAESTLEAVRALGVWRTPTVLVIDSAGQVTSRIAGQPTRRQVAEAAAAVVPELAPAGAR